MRNSLLIHSGLSLDSSDARFSSAALRAASSPCSVPIFALADLLEMRALRRTWPPRRCRLSLGEPYSPLFAATRDGGLGRQCLCFAWRATQPSASRQRRSSSNGLSFLPDLDASRER